MYLNDALDTDPPRPADFPAREDAPPLGRFVNRAIAGAWRRGALSRPTLDPAELEAEALAAEGLPCIADDGHWRPALALLTRALVTTADLSPLGRGLAHGQLVRILRARARAAALWSAHPEILDRPVAAPVIVLGQMRSGTTRIHRLLGTDPRFLATRLFETIEPVPRAGLPRAVTAWAGLRLLTAINPALAAVHPTGPFAVEEEFGLLSFALCGAQFEAQWRVPAFARHWEAADTRAVYADFRRLLQTIGWARGDDPATPWLLKVPQFMQDLPALLAEFPDARLLCLDRDPAAVVASSASLVWHQRRVHSRRADRYEIGREWLYKTALRGSRAAAARTANAHVPQLDIDYAAVDADWRAEMHRIYAFLGLDLDTATLRRMARYIAGARSHARHGYAAADFGLAA